MTRYKQPIDKNDCDCSRGAPMGRLESRPGYPDRDKPLKFHLTRVKIDAGGYDIGGAYWGLGAPLYCAECCQWIESEERDIYALRFYRANNRDAAKQAVKTDFPNASFYR